MRVVFTVQGQATCPLDKTTYRYTARLVLKHVARLVKIEEVQDWAREHADCALTAEDMARELASWGAKHGECHAIATLTHETRGGVTLSVRTRAR